ncbi:MAG: sulfatase-like hydrolase/transferase, partial [Bdellovibrionota bacterium]
MLIHLPFWVIESIDLILVDYIGKRMTIGNFYLFNEVPGRSGIIIPFLIPMLFQIILILSLIYLIFKAAKQRPIFPYPLRIGKHLGLSLITLAVLTVAGRGGTQPKPVNFSPAQVFHESFLNEVVLNSSFTVIKSWSKKTLKRKQYFSSPAEYIPLLNWKADVPRAHWAKDIRFQSKPNIVLIIMESFSLEYMALEPGEVTYTPFLDTIAAKSLFFTNAFASGRRSIEGIGAIFAGVPQMMDEPFISSEFSTNEFRGLGTMLTEQ